MALNSVSEDIRQLLNDNSKGTQGVDLFPFEWGCDDTGAEIDKQILVIDGPNIDVIVKEDFERPTFVIYVRGSTNESSKSVYDRVRDIYEFMIVQERQTINGTEYLQYEPIAAPIALTKDSNNRFTYSINFSTYRNAIGA